MNFSLLRNILINKATDMVQFIENEPDSNIDVNQLQYFVTKAINNITTKIENNPFSKYAEYIPLGVESLSAPRKEALLLAAQTAISQKGFSNELIAEIGSYLPMEVDLHNVDCSTPRVPVWFLVIKEF